MDLFWMVVLAAGTALSLALALRAAKKPSGQTPVRDLVKKLEKLPVPPSVEKRDVEPEPKPVAKPAPKPKPEALKTAKKRKREAERCVKLPEAKKPTDPFRPKNW